MAGLGKSRSRPNKKEIHPKLGEEALAEFARSRFETERPHDKGIVVVESY